MRRLALLVVLLASSTASAEGVEPHESMAVLAKGAPRPYALTVNEPFGWKTASSIAASAYAQLGEHHAVRFNIASYERLGKSASNIMDGETAYEGRLFDVSAGWMYFPRRIWEGPTFEAGLLHRSFDIADDDGFDEEIDARKGQFVAVRGLLGWSWMIRNRVMISFALGASHGYAFGTETHTDYGYGHPEMSKTVELGKLETSFEGYLRFGFTFGSAH
jgi:hypothetical protein